MLVGYSEDLSLKVVGLCWNYLFYVLLGVFEGVLLLVVLYGLWGDGV